ncbi:MAG: hypothetical protein F7B20_02225 [Aeropyrum sp.]|nr:hypothetical protein [Aeropyrum sp.]MCE4615825.1 hypothetical protein [Aeropyrum sp.]
MRGVISGVLRLRGKGFIAYSTLQSQALLGYGGGATRKFSTRFSIRKPREARAERVMISIGLFLPTTLTLPVRWKLALDGVTLSREIKPQVVVGAENAKYARLVIDATPLLSQKFTERSVHSIFAFYDGAHPVTLADAFVVAAYSCEGSEYSVEYFTGAASLEPGEIYKTYAQLGPSMGGSRSAVVSAHIPNPKSVMELVAGGSRRERIRGPGYRVARVEVPYRGSEIPVAIIYRRPETPLYPKTVIAGDILVHENRIEGFELKMERGEVSKSGGSYIVSLKLSNEGREEVRDIRIALTDTPGPAVIVERLQPGDSRSVTLKYLHSEPASVYIDAIVKGIRVYKEFRL